MAQKRKDDKPAGETPFTASMNRIYKNLDEMKELIQELKTAEAKRIPEVQNTTANISNGKRIMALLNPREDQVKIGQDYVEIEIQHLGINFSCSTIWWNTQSNEKALEELEKRYNRNNKTDVYVILNGTMPIAVFETESMAEDFVSNNACQYGALYIRKITFDWNQIEERMYK